MPPHNLNFGGGVSQTIVNPIVLLVVLVLGLVICLGSRRKALVAFLLGAILIPQDQVVLIGALHFDMLRILILFGCVRMVRTAWTSSRKFLPGGWNKIDWALLILTVFIALNGILLWRQWGMVVYQLSGLYEAFGIYFLLCLLIRDQEDVVRAIRVFACIAAVVAVVMIYEQATGMNPVYGLLGGARADIYGSAMERAGRFRAVAMFGHPILAGTFGAILLPLFVGLWWRGKTNRWFAGLGMVASLVIPLAANSSTSLFGLIGGLIALCLWPLRNWMRPVRWGLVATLVGLHVVMKAPVWHLISRIDLAGGSSSYHRYQLVNQCILHFNDWWLIGTKSPADWGWDMWDLSNQYVGTADTAGLIPLLAFLAIIVFGFKYLGRARKAAQRNRRQELFIWAMGAALFANAVAFFGISYFDQTIVAWYALLAMIPVVAISARVARTRQTELAAEPASEPLAAAFVDQPQTAPPALTPAMRECSWIGPAGFGAGKEGGM